MDPAAPHHSDTATGDEIEAAASAVAGDVASAADTSQSRSSAVSDAADANDANDAIEFVVQYGRVNNMTIYETVAKLENVSTSI